MDARTLIGDSETDFLEDFLPQLDPIETTGRADQRSNYRDFLVQSCQKDITFNHQVYSCVDIIEMTGRAENYAGCRTYANFVRHKETGKVRVQASSCRLRWCPLCIRAKKQIIVQEVAGWLKTLKRPKFLTFTLKHREEPLRDTVKDLYKFFRNVRKTKWFKKNVRGGVWFFQVTKSKTDGLWHPHIHCLVDSNFLPKEELSELWELITGDSKIVDVRAVKDNAKTAEYVARYATTPCRLASFELHEAVEIVQTLHGRRICGTWGTGRVMSFKIEAPEDAADWERIGNFWIVWNDTINSGWCRIIKLAFIHDQPLQYLPPPDLMGRIPWDNEIEEEPEPFIGNQLEMF